VRALDVITRAYSSKSKIDFPLSSLTRLLCFDDEQDARRFLDTVGVPVEERRKGQERVLYVGKPDDPHWAQAVDVRSLPVSKLRRYLQSIL